MNRFKRLDSIAKLRILFFCLSAFCVLYSSSYAQTQPRMLALNTVLEDEIKGGEIDSYAVEIVAGQTARIEIEQKGVDVALAAYKPDGARFIETESPSGVIGSDLILVTAQTAGVYRVDVQSSDPRAAVGKYTIKLAEIRPTRADDNEINAAAARITKVADEATVLRQNGTRDGRRKAIEKFQDVVTLSRIKRDKIWEVVALITTGLLYEQLGEVQRSLDYYLAGLALARETGNRQYQGSAINNLAVGYLTLGDYETSLSYLTQALELQTAAGNRRGQGVVYNNFGTAYLLLGDAKKSEESYRQALVIRREVKDERGEGFVLNNLGQVFLETADHGRAKEFLDEALALRKRIADKQGEAVTLRNLGKLNFKIGDDLKAYDYLKQANAISNAIGDRRVEADTFYWLASAEARSGDTTKAIDHIEQGLGIIEQIRGEIVNPQLRTGYLSTVPQFYELYISLLVARFEKSRDERDIALALQISERARARTLVELLQEARVDIKKGVDEKALDELQENLNAKYRDRTGLLSGKNTPEQVSKLTAEINSLTADIENLEVKIRRENPAFADLAYGSALSSAEIQSLLDDKTVLIEYKLGDSRSFLWLVTKDSVRMFHLPPRAQIEALAGEYYQAVITRKQSISGFSKLENDLDRILLGQVAGLINGKRVAIVADGFLQMTPFSALPSVSVNEIVSLPSSGVLAELRRNVTPRKASPTIAIFADPVFGANDSRLATSQPTAKEKSVALTKVLRDFDLEKGLPRLISSRMEARDIASLLPAKQVVTNLDFDATIEKANGDALKKYDIIHFATHGLLDTKRAESSGLVFSMYDKKGLQKDGFMRLSHIYDLDLASDLVVLSACQTALGKDVRGEGLIGLTRGFMYAGARRVVASLWKVDDAATAEFMKRFYRIMLKEKQPAAAALKKAQTEMRSVPRFRSPFYWAGFTLQGDWQ